MRISGDFEIAEVICYNFYTLIYILTKKKKEPECFIVTSFFTELIVNLNFNNLLLRAKIQNTLSVINCKLINVDRLLK